jgi:hypothetical protein
MDFANLLPGIQHVIRCEKQLSIEMEKSNGCNGNLLILHLYVIVKYARHCFQSVLLLPNRCEFFPKSTPC